MTGEITPVTFLNKEGMRLFGMLHRPLGVSVSRTAIILLSPGVKMRVAPHRLYNNMAERFCALGFPVLRFDFYGLGDSEGEAPEQLLADLYGAIQVGRYVGDTIAAMDWMEAHQGVSQFVLSGLCGGAITGLLTGARDRRVVSLLGLAIPVILDGSQIDYTRYMDDAQLTSMRKSAWRRAWRSTAWQSWVRFFTFRSNYRLMAQSIVKPLFNRFRSANQQALKTESAVPKDNTNPHFGPAFFEFLSTSRPIYLVFAEVDRHMHEFEGKFMERNRDRLQAYRTGYEIHVTKQSNHIFSFPEWEEDMLTQCCRWLRGSRSHHHEGQSAKGEVPSDSRIASA
jgi:dienelactone hydrolase